MKTHKNDDNTNNSEVSSDQESLKMCFVIMPISDHIDYAPGHFKRVYNHIIEPACLLAGFKAKRADDVKSANVIMLDVLENILHSDMAICDLSSRNPNVMYELGIRQSFDMPVAIIKDFVTKEVFDIQGIRYEEYDSQLRIDLVAEAVKRIAEAIKHTYENKGSDVSSLVQLLGRSKAVVRPSDLSIETRFILDAIAQLRGQVNSSSLPQSNPAHSNDIESFPQQSMTLSNGLNVALGDLVNMPGFGNGRVKSLTHVVHSGGSDDAIYVQFESGTSATFGRRKHGGFSKVESSSDQF